MTVLFTILHILVCAFLVLVILLQQGRGGGMGAAFGGASTQVFGGAGAGNFLTRLTEIAAFTFMFTSIILAGLASNRGPSRYEEAAQALYLGQTSASVQPSASIPPTAPVVLPAPPPPMPTPAPTTTPTTTPAPTTAPVETAPPAPSTTTSAPSAP